MEALKLFYDPVSLPSSSVGIRSAFSAMVSLKGGFTSMPPSEYLLFHNVVCVSQAVARLSRTFFDFASCSHITGSDRAALEDLGFARVSKS